MVKLMKITLYFRDLVTHTVRISAPTPAKYGIKFPILKKSLIEYKIE